MRRVWFELFLAVAVGAGHLVVDGLFGLKGYYIGAAVIVIAVYAAVRLRAPGQASAWGLGSSYFKPSAAACAAFLTRVR
ncbi:MAG TPA: hypothetical protein VFV34_08540 [Blastocatellia bacterium]|nr:hypothetical protein [Blastocatellia bacterium]